MPTSPIEEPLIEPFRSIYTTPSKRDRLSDLVDKAKLKAQDILHISHDEVVDDRTDEHKQVDSLVDDVAFNPQKVIHRPLLGSDGQLKHAAKKALSVSKALFQPEGSAITKATGATAAKFANSGPQAGLEADLEFLDACEDVEELEQSRRLLEHGDEFGESDKRLLDLQAKLETMTQKRMGNRVAWHTSRHVHRARVVRKEPVPFPPFESFEQPDRYGQPKINWKQYCIARILYGSHPFTAHYIDTVEELPFDVAVLQRHVERLVIACDPLQAFWASLRAVFTWEDRMVTLKWCAIYWTLFYFKHIATFCIGYIIYTTIRRASDTHRVDSLRQSTKRAMEHDSKAVRIAEMMDKHGDDWLSEAVNAWGPALQIQINDAANLLEIVYNFSHWVVPSKTRATLVALALGFLVCAFGSVDLCITIIWFWLGLVFFALWPIATLYPQYRIVVSLLRWIFYDVPTHAEWAFMYLQQKSLLVLKALEVESDGQAYTGTEDMGEFRLRDGRLFVKEAMGEDTNAPSATIETGIPKHAPNQKRPVDILSFRCQHKHTPGRLIISSIGLRFHSSLPHTSLIDKAINNKNVANPSTDFSIAFPQIEELKKTRPRNAMLSRMTNMTVALDRLEIKVRDLIDEDVQDGETGDRRGEDGILEDGGQCLRTIVLEAMSGRDRAFNAIIGFSGLKWQSLQYGGADGSINQAVKGHQNGS